MSSTANNVARVITALAGECQTCGWRASCGCDVCEADQTHILYRCTMCWHATSMKHGDNIPIGDQINAKPDGTPMLDSRHWKRI